MKPIIDKSIVLQDIKDRIAALEAEVKRLEETDVKEELVVNPVDLYDWGSVTEEHVGSLCSLKEPYDEVETNALLFSMEKAATNWPYTSEDGSCFRLGSPYRKPIKLNWIPNPGHLPNDLVPGNYCAVLLHNGEVVIDDIPQDWAWDDSTQAIIGYYPLNFVHLEKK